MSLIFRGLFGSSVLKSTTPKERFKAKNPPKPEDFDNYYVYKSALAQFNDNEYAEFLERCKNGDCVYVEKEVISPELEKGNNAIKNINEKL